MTTTRYRPIHQYFTAHPAALRTLCVLTKGSPLLAMLLYPLLLLLLSVRALHVFSDPAALQLAVRELVRAVLVPLGVLVGGSLLRHVLNFPRPYEQAGFVPLIEKDTAGHSFPSRHAMSAGVIAAAWLRTSSVMGGILLVLTAVICLTRVLAGVHHERDVLCGAALGIGLGLLGMFL